MSDRLTQMLATLLERFPNEPALDEMESFLASHGLNRQEIGEVLSLFFDGMAPPSKGAVTLTGVGRQPLTPSLRVQGPHERGRFSAEAWGYLTLLRGTGAVPVFDFEHLVERALFHIDGRIGLPEIRALADELGLDAPAMESDRTLLH